ncbi:hypothetical protein THEYE_A2023 [Thermodesulfovibrio yellowstonii DSM 11347]|uniref:Uncharacterized protein n=1 Tax=Thermodesulfovibrio yellowstonii (strain ATCC 51303 / DSM 11347 / YP87) TaxID=289376 RepID=B5YIT6_THEYD|nr:hypothetical protein THEYE_A2023 [Thermodesulfovibrio yellowstonii DSM 11347]
MVQMKPTVTVKDGETTAIVFISHMVQMKLFFRMNSIIHHYILYIPHGSDET